MNAEIKCFSSFHLWNIAADAVQHARKDKTTNPKVCTAGTITAILLSAMSTEAFINELGDRLQNRLTLEITELERWTSIGTLLKQLEEEKSQIKTKYLLASQVLPGKPLTAGAPPFQEFDRLIDVRNRIVHTKTLEHEPKFMEYFRRKQWLYDKPEDQVKLIGWLFQLETPEVAAWACRAAYDLITNFVERFSGNQHPVILEVYAEMNFQWSKISNDSRLK